MKIQSLLHCADMGRFVSAPFAPSVPWTPQKVSSLFDSLYRGWPIGEIVLWMPLAAPNQSTTAPSGEMIVDGAQRIIAIYSALRGRAPAFAHENVDLRCSWAFNIVREQFAPFDLVMTDDKNWIDLAAFFTPDTPAIGKTMMALFDNPPAGISNNEIVRRLHRLSGISDRDISVRNMPPEVSGQDCHDFFRLVHESGRSECSPQLRR